jgi:hypothetical protein
MDLGSITFGVFVGAIGWEIFKQIVSAISKRVQESADSKRKMLREDIQCLAEIVCDINEAAVNYFLSEFTSDTAKDLSKQIRAKAKTAGLKLHAVKAQLSASSLQNVEIQLWIAFKAAASKHLDVARTDVWKDDDPRLAEIYRAANYLHAALNKARYATI